MLRIRRSSVDRQCASADRQCSDGSRGGPYRFSWLLAGALWLSLGCGASADESASASRDAQVELDQAAPEESDLDGDPEAIDAPDSDAVEEEAPYDLGEDIQAVLAEGQELRARLERVGAGPACADEGEARSELAQLRAQLERLEALSERWNETDPADRDALAPEVESLLDELAEVMIRSEELLAPCEI